jgi:hypothetical protein
VTDIRPKHTLPPMPLRRPGASSPDGTDAEREKKLRARGYVA